MADRETRDQGDGRRIESPSPLQIPAITGEEKDVAAAAHGHFDAGNYNGCVEQVRRLATMRPTDPKVQHNAAVAMFYQSGCRKVEEFRRSLGQVSNQVCLFLFNVTHFENNNQGSPLERDHHHLETLLTCAETEEEILKCIFL